MVSCMQNFLVFLSMSDPYDPTVIYQALDIHEVLMQTPNIFVTFAFVSSRSNIARKVLAVN